MTRLIKKLNMSFGDVKTANISTPPLTFYNYSKEDIDVSINQGFVWHPNFVGFEIRNQIGSCIVEIHISNHLELESNTERAIVVPYYVSDENYFYLSDENSEVRIDLKSGQYQLLYQNRYLTDSEIESSGEFEDVFDPKEDPDSFRPELCLLTFIPTTEVIEPQILRREPGFNPPSELIMFDEPMPPA